MDAEQMKLLAGVAISVAGVVGMLVILAMIFHESREKQKNAKLHEETVWCLWILPDELGNIIRHEILPKGTNPLWRDQMVRIIEGEALTCQAAFMWCKRDYQRRQEKALADMERAMTPAEPAVEPPPTLVDS